MIRLHRLSHAAEPFELNPSLISTVESAPDTIVHLVTGQNLLVNEAVEEVVAAVRAWHVGVATDALSRSRA